MHRLKQRNLSWVDISRRSKPQSSRQLRREVAGDIAEKIAGDDHAKLARIADQFRGQCIDIKMAGLDLRIFAAHLRENALPKLVPERERVRFIAHQDFAQFARAGVFEGVTDDALDAAARIDVFLDGDLVWIAAPELAACTGVKSFGILAKNDEANVVFAAIAQRSQRCVEQLHGPRVHVEIELGAQAEQNIGGVAIRRHARIAHSAEKNGVEIAPEHFHGAGGKRGAVAQEALGAPIELHEFGLAVGFSNGSAKNPYGLRYDFHAGAVARNERNAFGGSVCSSGGVHEISACENWMRPTL